MKLGICTFDQIAKVSLGYKSLQNQFYYLDKDTIKKYDIEAKYLKPIYQLADIHDGKYKQTVKAVLKVFYCKEKEQDLHGTGALEYIRAMENIPAKEKKQGGKKQTIKSALQDQTSKGGTWYMPKAKLHKMHLWMRKGIGSVYSPIIFEDGGTMDQRCNYVLPHEGLDWKVVGAFLTSSLFAFSTESYGSASMGAGVLELATTMAHGLRVVDLRTLKDKKAIEELIRLAEDVWDNTEPVDWERTEQPSTKVQELDKWFLSHLETKVMLERIYSDLIATLKSRIAVAEDKEAQTKKGEQVNINTVAASIVETVRPLLESKNFPESFVEPTVAMQPLDLSHAEKLQIECHPMMGQALLLVKDGGTKVLIEGQYPRSVAQVIVKALLMGRRRFTYPAEVGSAETALKGFSKWFPKILNKIADGCGMSAVGTGYEKHVSDAVLTQLHLDRHISTPEFFGEVSIR